MQRQICTWVVLASLLPAPLLGQDWKPVSDKPAPGITLGKPQRKREAPPRATLPLPSQAVEYHAARRPGDLDRLPEPAFPPASSYSQTKYQVPQTAEEQFNCGVVAGPAPVGHPGAPGTHPFSGLKDCWNRIWCPTPGSSHPMSQWDARSDQCFRDFISPISNPAYFEDPRSLTEIRPIFMYQRAGDNPFLQNGSLFVFNLQGRISINDRWSLVLHRLGFATVNTGDGALIDGGTGLTDIQIGTKYTFYRDDRANKLAAAGVSFEIPIGNASALSGTGGAMTPYVSYGQGCGDFHFLASAGYRFGFNDASSEFFFTSLHFDYGFFKRFYPLFEVNWYHYTSNGTSTVANFEGTDLFNLGASDVEGRDFVTAALGFRVLLKEGLSTGLAYERMLVGTNGPERWRVIFDLIFRY